VLMLPCTPDAVVNCMPFELVLGHKLLGLNRCCPPCRPCCSR
jgi:hypothetical protein